MLTGSSFAFLYFLTVRANATVQLGERLQQITLPDPSIQWFGEGDEIMFAFPHLIEFLRNSVRQLHYTSYYSIGSHWIKAFENRIALYDHHLGLYERYLKALLELSERHCPGVSALLALLCMGQDLYRLLNWHNWSFLDGSCFSMSPIFHPQPWDPDGPELTNIYVLDLLLPAGIHPIQRSILNSWVPKICLETVLSFLRYLRYGGHSFQTRKSLKPLVKSSYFKRLKVQPWLSCVRKRRQRRFGGVCVLGKQHLRVWWDDTLVQFCPYLRGTNSASLRFFSYRTKYATNYDLWYTYRHALQLLPIFLAKAPPDSQLAARASNCIFNSFCTAYPQDTRKAKKALKHYLSRCRPIKMLPIRTVVVHDGMCVD